MMCAQCLHRRVGSLVTATTADEELCLDVVYVREGDLVFGEAAAASTSPSSPRSSAPTSRSPR
jgi:hypothetical protein